MNPLIWLVAAIIAAASAYLVGWPAWRSYRGREARDLNTERYLAWRGRAPRGSARMSEGMTADERRRIWLGAILAAASVALLVAFFVTS